MRRLGEFKDETVPALVGALEGRAQAGMAGFGDFRVLLNAGMPEAGRRERLCGWLQRGSDLSSGRSNEDLRDQLLDGAGAYVATLAAGATIPNQEQTVTVTLSAADAVEVNDRVRMGGIGPLLVTVVNGATVTVRSQMPTGGVVAQGAEVFRITPGKREVILRIREVSSDSADDVSGGSRLMVACTKSRIYASTGAARNWRILADGLGGSSQSVWPAAGWDIAQLGGYVLFTNNIDPVLAWQYGDPAQTGATADRLWSAFEVTDLLGLGIERARCLCAWNGFMLVGAGARVYWSDFNRPLEFAPGGESAAGYVEMGQGEVVLRIEPLGGQLRVYTNLAIYQMFLTGGNEVFRAPEIYRGPDVLAYPNSLVNLGDRHLFLTKVTMVELPQYDKTPIRVEWIHRAVGLVFNGLADKWLEGLPDGYPFRAFGGVDTSRCHQVVAAFEPLRQEIWLSWPTGPSSAQNAPGISEAGTGNAYRGSGAWEEDVDGKRRMTLVLNCRYHSATLVDAGFSAFAAERVSRRMTVRDFLVEYGVWRSDADCVLLLAKEGEMLNTVAVAGVTPTCLYNSHVVNGRVVPLEDPNLKPTPDSLCSLAAGLDLIEYCNSCESPEVWVMASTNDLTLKVLSPGVWERERYVAQKDTAAHYFPGVSLGESEQSESAYVSDGYPTLMQSESSHLGARQLKQFVRLGVTFEHATEPAVGRLWGQLGLGNEPGCLRFYDSVPRALDCLTGGKTAAELKASGQRGGLTAVFPFYRAGQFVAWRLFVSDTPVTGADANYRPVGVGAAFNQVAVRWSLKQAK